MKKKLLALLLTLALSTCLVACGGDDAKKDADTSVNDEKDDVDADADVDTPNADSDADVDTPNADSDKETTDADIDTDVKLTGVLTFDVPEGFEYDGYGNYTSTDATVLASINVTEVASDGSFADVTKEMLLAAMDYSLESGFGIELDVQMPVYEEITIDGRDAIKYTIEYEYSGMTICQTQYIIDDIDYYRYVTYTNTEGDGYDDVFAASAESISFKEGSEGPVVIETPDTDEGDLSGNLTFDIPEGFEDNGTGYYENSDPTIVANINVTEVGSDGSFSMVTKDFLFEAMDASLDAGFGTDIDVEMPVYEELVIDGRNSVKYTIKYEYNGIALVQTQYMIDDGDYYRYVTYTNVDGDGFEDVFAASGDSIRFE